MYLLRYVCIYIYNKYQWYTVLWWYSIVFGNILLFYCIWEYTHSLQYTVRYLGISKDLVWSSYDRETYASTSTASFPTTGVIIRPTQTVHGYREIPKGTSKYPERSKFPQASPFTRMIPGIPKHKLLGKGLFWYVPGLWKFFDRRLLFAGLYIIKSPVWRGSRNANVCWIWRYSPV